MAIRLWIIPTCLAPSSVQQNSQLRRLSKCFDKKKNWLFAGSEAAGQRAAVIQSLLQTACLNGIEPMAWLTDTLEKLPTWPNRRLDELLPIKLPA